MSIELNNIFDLEKSALTAHEVNKDEYSSLKEIVNIWQRVASERKSEEVFKDSECALFLISSGFQSKDPSFQMFVCKDSNGTPQALMRIRDAGFFLEIMALAANPTNIGIGQNRQLRGAGTCLLAKAEEIALLRKKEAIRLISLPTSLKFYEKRGFVVEDSTNLELFMPLSERSLKAANVG
jgi:histone acetyltransferase (RNA polymerase elongator complex component)